MCPLRQSGGSEDNSTASSVAKLSKPRGRSSSRRRSSVASHTSQSFRTTSRPRLKVKTPKPRGSRRTLYDAVAGRLTRHGFRDTPSHLLPSRKGDTLNRALAPITPAEALLNRRDRRERKKHDPFSDVLEDLLPTSSSKTTLPDSDLLKAVHAYASDFYHATTEDNGVRDWQSLDETGLLAVGILMEEEVASVLGKNGWTLFIEQQDLGSLKSSRKLNSKHDISTGEQGKIRSRPHGEPTEGDGDVDMDGHISDENEDHEREEGNVENEDDSEDVESEEGEREGEGEGEGEED